MYSIIVVRKQSNSCELLFPVCSLLRALSDHIYGCIYVGMFRVCLKIPFDGAIITMDIRFACMEVVFLNFVCKLFDLVPLTYETLRSLCCTEHCHISEFNEKDRNKNISLYFMVRHDLCPYIS